MKTLKFYRHNIITTILFFFITVSVSCLILFYFVISRSVTIIHHNLLESVKPVATIHYDSWTSHLYSRESGGKSENLKIETIRQIGHLPEVRQYNFIFPMTLFSQNLRNYWNYETSILFQNMDPRSFLRQNSKGYEWHFIEGVETSVPIKLDAGLISLYNGRLFTYQELGGENVAFISREFSIENNLRLGDTLYLQNWFFPEDPFSTWDETIKNIYSEDVSLEIIGLFKLNNKENYKIDEIGQRNMNDIINTIFIPNNTAHKLKINSCPECILNNPYTLFLLNSSAELPYFIESANELLPAFFEIRDLTQVHSHIVNFINNTSSALGSIRVGILVLGLPFYFLLFILLQSFRKKEYAIYLSLGMAKATLYKKSVYELSLLMFISTLMSILIILITSNSILDIFMQTSISNYLSNASDIPNYTVLGTPVTLPITNLMLANFSTTSVSFDANIYISSILDIGEIIYIFFLYVILILSTNYIFFQNQFGKKPLRAFL